DASIRISSVVRPLDGAPVISDSCPRRSPPCSAASSASSPDAARRSGAIRAVASAASLSDVSVTSSLRARRSDSRAALIGQEATSLFLRLDAQYRPAAARDQVRFVSCYN